MGAFDLSPLRGTPSYGAGPTAGSHAFYGATLGMPPAALAGDCTFVVRILPRASSVGIPRVLLGATDGAGTPWIGQDGSNLVFNNGGSTVVAQVVADAWHELALVITAGQVTRLYYDGVGTAASGLAFSAAGTLALGGLGSLGNYDWQYATATDGSASRIGPAVVYEGHTITGDYTPSTTTPAPGSGVRALWLFDGNTADTAAAGPTITLASLGLAPATATVQGGATRQLALTGYYSDGSTADLTGLAAYGNNPAVGSTVAGLFTAPAAGSSGVNVVVTATHGGLSATATMTVPAASQSSVVAIAPNNANIVYEGRWDVTSGRALAVNCGPGLRFDFAGDSVKLKFDLSTVNSPFIIDAQVDDDGWVRTTIGGSTASITLAPSRTASTAVRATAHSCRVVIAGIYEGAGIWSGTDAVRFTGIELPAGGTLLPGAPALGLVAIHGDSIAASVFRNKVPDGPGDQTVMDGRNHWPRRFAARLGLAPEVVGFGATGLTKGGSGGVPRSQDSFAFVCGNIPWNPIVKPIAVVDWIGTNDRSYVGTGNPSASAAYQALYLAYLQQQRTAYPAAVIFAVVPPACLNLQAAILGAAAAMSDSRVIGLDYSSGPGGGYDQTQDTSDGIHPNPGGSARIAARLAADIKTHFDSLGIGIGSGSPQDPDVPTGGLGLDDLVPLSDLTGVTAPTVRQCLAAAWLVGTGRESAPDDAGPVTAVRSYQDGSVGRTFELDDGADPTTRT